MGGGCAGFQYDSVLRRSTPTETYESSKVNDVKPRTPTRCQLHVLDGDERSTMSKGFQGAGFKFNNPNSTGSCGCGSSFSV